MNLIARDINVILTVLCGTLILGCSAGGNQQQSSGVQPNGINLTSSESSLINGNSAILTASLPPSKYSTSDFPLAINFNSSSESIVLTPNLCYIESANGVCSISVTANNGTISGSASVTASAVSFNSTNIVYTLQNEDNPEIISYAYFLNYDTNDVVFCAVDESGIDYPNTYCAHADMQIPEGMNGLAYNPTTNIAYAFFRSLYLPVLVGKQTIGMPGLIDYNPFAIVNNAQFTANYALFTESSGSIIQCQLNNAESKIIDSSCEKKEIPNSVVPWQIDVYGNKAYIVNYGDEGASNGFVSVCNYESSTGLNQSSCSVMPMLTNLNGPNDIKIVNGVLYTANWLGNSYTYLDLKNPVAGSHTVQLPILQNPSLITSFGNYIYFLNYKEDINNDSFTQCHIDMNGIIESNTCVEKIPQNGGVNILHGPWSLIFLPEKI